MAPEPSLRGWLRRQYLHLPWADGPDGLVEPDRRTLDDEPAMSS